MSEVPITEECVLELEKRNKEMWQQIDALQMQLAMTQTDEIVYQIRKNKGIPATPEMLSDIKFLLDFIDRFHIVYGSRVMGKTKFLNIRAKYKKVFK